ncbi:putative ABC transport system permease protein [Aequitasia blattaphilus]|uniref:ABC transporter permease n=1 Tax=Aequitasia blattaphilus TaxID=2949332 RepID=A0ABT1E9E0_9FIRM|nr:ABC transporter permease [Aequitasia blattaphilus]MCP1102432.1 ABC transporter permease [Aequitasia blattaphilus]MCR8615072.1 ABC transporter permease [Aequitasia blattaphilus]
MGQIMEYVKMAIYNIAFNKGRSFLTMLGIIIGISSVITVVSIGSGVKAAILKDSKEKTVTVTVNQDKSADTQIITPEDMVLIKKRLGSRIKGVATTMPVYGTAYTNKGKFDTDIAFTTPDTVRDPYEKKLIRGSYFTEEDIKNAELKCVIDKEGALFLFGNLDVIGMNLDVLIDNKVQSVQIIGIRDTDPKVMEENQQAAKLYDMKMPLDFEMPYTSYEAWGGNVGINYSSITAYLAPGEKANRIGKEIIKTLNTLHTEGGESLFKKEKGMDITKYMTQTVNTLTTFVGFVAGISLLVGGIGVMNIMLVSVTERTREIGIRKSLGARTNSIVTQFLFESAIISVIGGMIGIVSGAGIAVLVSSLKITGISAKLSIGAVIIATCFSCGVGIIFGIYPARKAARLSPIEALRQM